MDECGCNVIKGSRCRNIGGMSDVDGRRERARERL